MLKFDVVIPIYNEEENLPEFIDAKKQIAKLKGMTIN